MAMKKMKPKAFAPEQVEALKSESSTQTTGHVVQKSSDPDNFPVFDIPVNSKVLVYVPNHIKMNEEGEEELRMDKALLHSVIDGKKFPKIRCIRGLSSALGYSGDCPLCSGEGEPWDLANEQIKEQCKIRGLDVNDSENEAVKSVKREYYSKRVVKAPDTQLAFPIVVIETDPNNFKEILVDENGVPRHKAYWYTISKSSYEKKWCKTLEGMEDEPTHPGGYFFILNYTYESKNGDYNKRDSARELQVVHKSIKGSEAVAQLFNEETADWDEYKAMSTIYDHMYYEEKDLEEEVDRLLAGTREKLAIYESTAAMPALGASPAFNLQTPQEEVGGMLPMADSVDE